MLLIPEKILTPESFVLMRFKAELVKSSAVAGGRERR
jgi:hypothetical protein